MFFGYIGGKMKKFISVLFLIFSPVNINAADESYVIDDSHFSLGFLVDHAGYSKTLGLFKHIEGSYTFNDTDNIIKNLSITVKTDSVFTNHDKRDAHLRSPDFLNSEEFPTMTFSVDEYDLNKTPNKLVGDLTLLGVTKPITLEFTINKVAQYPFRVGLSKPMVMGVSAKTSFKRSDFGMTYGVSKKLVGDEMDLIIEFEARRQ